MLGLTGWRDDKISKLEETLESYRLRNKQLEEQLTELNELKLRCKIQQMLINDDPAIDELLECSKNSKIVPVGFGLGASVAEKERMVRFEHGYANAIAAQTANALSNSNLFQAYGMQQAAAFGFASNQSCQMQRNRYLDQLSSAAMW